MSFSVWISSVFSSLPLFCIMLLTAGVIFVNGWTDAPNAIASCVATRAMSPGCAVAVSAVCNFIGLAFSLSLSRKVTDTVTGMVDFGSDPTVAQAGLCAGMFAVVLWAVAAWWFGIPTSESHALMAGLTGAALAVQGGSGVGFACWSRILWGLFVSLVFGFGLGFFTAKIFTWLTRRASRKNMNRTFRCAQIGGGIVNSLLHGAQDGQKFIGVLLLSVAGGKTTEVPSWMIFFCAGLLSLGTSLGGYRIIRSVGMKMARLNALQGVSADGGCAVGLWLCTLWGLPVSTTHVKTTAIMGAGCAENFRKVHWQVAGEMGLAWLCTFPGCGLLGYAAARIFLFLF